MLDSYTILRFQITVHFPKTMNIFQTSRDISHDVPQLEGFWSLANGDRIKVFVAESCNVFSVNELLQIHGTQLHVKTVPLVFIDSEPPMLQNRDDISVTAIRAEFRHNANFIVNPHLDLLLVPANRTYELPRKFLESQQSSFSAQYLLGNDIIHLLLTSF